MPITRGGKPEWGEKEWISADPPGAGGTIFEILVQSVQFSQIVTDSGTKINHAQKSELLLCQTYFSQHQKTNGSDSKFRCALEVAEINLAKSLELNLEFESWL